MASVFYNKAKEWIGDGTIDLDTDTFKIMLVTASYTPDIDAHDFRDDVTNEVANGNGYTTGGATFASVTWAADNTLDAGKFDATDASWSTATFTARGAVIYKSRGGASSADELVCYIDFGSDKTSSGGTFLITWHANGIFYLT